MQRKNTIEVTRSVSGKIVRLTPKQWFHITESHDYMAGNMTNIMETVNSPDYIVEGSKNELIALKYYPITNLGAKHCVVVYKENKDGFIITGFFTSKPETIKKGGVMWQK